MINSVRNTVMFLLNKDNRGFITPSEFDYFAKQAQLEIFEGYFSEYARAVSLQNARRKAQGYGDIANQIQNKIDIFTTSSALSISSDSLGSYYGLPANQYKIINLIHDGKVVQEIQKHKWDMIVNSRLMAPSTAYRMYRRLGEKLYISPAPTTAATLNYIRKPEDPHWGYESILGDPVYSSSSSTDFELPPSDESDLVIRICKYAGLSVREKDVIEVTNAIETQEFQKKNT